MARGWDGAEPGQELPFAAVDSGEAGAQEREVFSLARRFMAEGDLESEEALLRGVKLLEGDEAVWLALALLKHSLCHCRAPRPWAALLAAKLKDAAHRVPDALRDLLNLLPALARAGEEDSMAVLAEAIGVVAGALEGGVSEAGVAAVEAVLHAHSSLREGRARQMIALELRRVASRVFFKAETAPGQGFRDLGLKEFDLGRKRQACLSLQLTELFGAGTAASAAALAELLAEEGEAREAERVFASAMSRAESAEQRMLFMVRFGTALHQRNPSRATVLLREAAGSGRPDSWRVWLKLGEAEGWNGNMEAAVEAFSKALNQKPDAGEAFLARGRVLAAMGRWEIAQKDFQRAHELGCPQAKSYLDRLGREETRGDRRSDGEEDPFEPASLFRSQKNGPGPQDYIGGGDVLFWLRRHEGIVRDPSLAKRYGLSGPFLLWFYGPPGCGKTMAARVAATMLQAPLGIVSGSSLYSHWWGRSNRRIGGMFSYLLGVRHPVVVLFDEVESLFGGNRFDGGQESYRSVTADLLIGIDRLLTEGSNKAPSLVVLTSNSLDIADLGLLRRVPTRVYVPPPTAVQRRALLGRLLGAFEPAPGVEAVVAEVARQEWSCSELAELADLAVRAAFGEAARRGRFVPVSAEHLRQAMAIIPPPVTLAKYFREHKHMLREFSGSGSAIGFQPGKGKEE